jgi:hypothetical protein
MREDEALRLLRALLDGEGAEWVEEGGWIRFRMRREAMLWETAARPCADGLLFYGRFPFRCADPDRARRVCEELNRRLARGAIFLAEDGCPVYRCRAELDDVYGAQERIAAALRYGAQVMTHCWGRLSGT